MFPWYFLSKDGTNLVDLLELHQQAISFQNGPCRLIPWGVCVHGERGGGGGGGGLVGRNSWGVGGEGRLAAELAYTLIDHKREGESGFKYKCIAIKSLPHNMNLACTFVNLILQTFQGLAENWSALAQTLVHKF